LDGPTFEFITMFDWRFRVFLNDREPDDYAYPLDQYDIPEERRAALQSYWDKRRLWLSSIETEAHRAIWNVAIVNGLHRASISIKRRSRGSVLVSVPPGIQKSCNNVVGNTASFQKNPNFL
jgi:hypothetical protein